jgi:multidrug resistance efflux pump
MIHKKDDTHVFLSWGARSFIAAPSSKILFVAVVAVLGSLVAGIILSFFIHLDVVVKTQGKTDSLLGVKAAVAQVAGQVDSLTIKAGDTVKEGKIIGQILIEGTSEEKLRAIITELKNKMSVCEQADCSEKREIFEALEMRDNSIKETLAEVNRRLSAYYYATSEMKAKSLAEVGPLNDRKNLIRGKLKFLETSDMKKYLLLQKESLEEESGRITQQITGLENQINDRIQSSKQEAVHSLRIAILNLESFIARHQIRAPVTGKVAKLNKTQGSFVTLYENIITIVPESSPIVAKVLLDSKDYAKVTEGNKVFIGLDAFPTHRYGYFTGKVLSINSVKETEKDSDFYLANISIDLNSLKRFPASEMKIFPGLKVEARIVTKRVPIIHIVVDKIVGEHQ